MRTRVLVLGANFGGMTAALRIKSALRDDVDVVVVSPTDRFIFTPSLIWMPFSRRHRDDLSFGVVPTLTSHGVEFVRAAAVAVDPVTHQVTLDSGRTTDYDYLVVATGVRHPEDVVPGFADHACTITDLAAAERSTDAWQRFLRDPGDVVVAASEGVGCVAAAYEFLFATAYHLEKAGLSRHVRLTYVTPEPFLGHLGLGVPHDEHLLAALMGRSGIEARTSAAIDHVDHGAVALSDGETVPFSFAMVLPPLVGQRFLRDADGLGDDTGLVRVRDTHQSEKYDDVYAIGAAAAVDAPWQTPTPAGVPRAGFPTEVMARTAALNIASQVRGEQPAASLPFGDTRVPVDPDQPAPPRPHGALVPGPQAYLMKIRYEKYFLWKMRHGYVHLL